MSYDPVAWSYKDAITSSKLQQMDNNNVWMSEHRIWGGEISMTGTSTVEVHPLRLEIGGTYLMEDTTANLVLTAENNAHWREGATQEGSATAWYVYAYNSASTVAVKFGASAPAYSDTSSGTALGIKMYDKSGSTWFRCIGAVLNDSGNAFAKYTQVGNEISYHNSRPNDSDAITLCVSGTAPANYTNLSLYPKIPKFIVSKAKLLVYGTTVSIRNSANSGTGAEIQFVSYVHGYTPCYIPIASGDAPSIDYKVGEATTTIFCGGYQLSIR